MGEIGIELSPRRRKGAEIGKAKFRPDSNIFIFPLALINSATLRLCGLIVALAISALAQAPTVEKMDPPSWWVGSTINPVRVLVRGQNLAGARIESATQGITASNFATSANGHYLFADIRIAENVKAGDYDLRVVTQAGAATSNFGIFPYNAISPFGFNGRFVYTRLSVGL